MIYRGALVRFFAELNFYFVSARRNRGREMLRLTTLCYVRREGEILLAMKKRGFGKGKWNGTISFAKQIAKKSDGTNRF